MQINVSQLLKETIGSVRNYEVSGTVDISDNDSGNTAHGKVELMRTNRSVLARATINTEVKVSCGRCLSLFSYPLELSIEEEYFPTLGVSSGASLELPDEPGCFTIDEYHILDLIEAVRQYGLMAIPMKPLCSKDCAGLKDKL